MEAGKAESGDMENVKHKFLQSHFLRVAVSSCEYIVCFWSSSFRRALVADWSFSVFAMYVINNQNLAIVLFNCRSNEEIIFDKDKMSKRQKSKLVFFVYFTLQMICWFKWQKNMLKDHYLIKTVSHLFKTGSQCSWNNIFQINTSSQGQKCHSLIFLYTAIKNVLVFLKTVP